MPEGNPKPRIFAVNQNRRFCWCEHRTNW